MYMVVLGEIAYCTQPHFICSYVDTFGYSCSYTVVLEDIV